MKNIFEAHKKKIAEQNAKMPEPMRDIMNPRRNPIVTINGKSGEYTGYSNITGMHHFSMFDGSLMRFGMIPDEVKKQL